MASTNKASFSTVKEEDTAERRVKEEPKLQSVGPQLLSSILKEKAQRSI